MSAEDQLDVLLEDLDEAESVGEVQTNILLLNKALEERETEAEFSSLVGDTDHLDLLSSYLDKMETKMSELDTDSNISNYSISVGGSLTGPAVSLSVTVGMPED